MSEIDVRIRPRPDGWADLPVLDPAQAAVVEAASTGCVIARGAPGSGRTTTALAVVDRAVREGREPLLLVPDRARADRLAPRVRALVPSGVRPVRTPASYAYSVVSTWRTGRERPLGGVELLTGAAQDLLLERLLLVDAPWPESMPPQMRQAPGFRAELRGLFARAGEAGLDGRALARAGSRFGQPQWIACGRLLDEYLAGADFDVETDGVLRVDLSRIQSMAADVIARWDDRARDRGVTAPIPLPDVLVVDDLQDCTPSTLALLRAARDRGARIVAMSDSDVAIAGYRGGEPHLDIRLADAVGCPILDLGAVRGQPEQIRSLVRSITGRIAQSGPAGRRRADVAPGAPSGRVLARLAASSAQLGALVARDLRALHLHEGIHWDDQAVIVRSASMVDEAARHLRRAGVPVSGGGRAFDFAAQPVTRLLLGLLLPPAPDLTEPERDVQATELLSSALVGADPLEIHRLLRRLNAARARADDLEQEGPPIGPSRLIAEPDCWRGTARGALAERLERAATLWGSRDRAHGMRPRPALWEAWVAADVADRWRDGALAAGPDSAWFDDQLDAVVALMRVADVWEQRTPTGRAGDFAEQLLAGTVPVDTIARTGVRPPGVHVLTPAQAVGGRWSVVAVLGLQDGAWPNTRLRDRILRADLLADIGAGRVGVGADGSEALIDDPHSARRAVLDDERRLLAAAVSRSTRVLIAGAVRAEDRAPSPFFDLIAAGAPVDRVDGVMALDEVPAPLDLDGQVADLRRIVASDRPGPEVDSAARLLALLMREGVPAADPATWLGSGGEQTTDAGIDGPIVLSPSSFETALACPLSWFLRRIGASPPAREAQRLGTLVHSLAERLPHGDQSELLAALEERLVDELGIDERTWAGRRRAEHARGVVRALADYLASIPGDVDVEQRIRVDIDSVTVSGRIDRIEHVDDGVRVTDLKTGSSTVSAKAAQDHAQLALYQVALRELGHRVVGGRLAYFGKEKKELRDQAALDDEALAGWRAAIADIGRIARGPAFTAVESNDACKNCPFDAVCPAKDRGRRTIE
ncbi:PD-(D/E)XK nuclease family protein [Actinomyces sp. B33]|uniref:UrvD/REP family ATP-dependent DNA helicase n=1 Tax=Actinomyces sp. B33 TaxID=2942131 RepID=UPI00233FCF76|nr:UrvD/REP family ATP-dependent DNA helicase [Actinomyces sp. B33]MDC4233794.1 PD-(D/E)XK nuclease family protein [Actinomyces sp. B33]